MANLSSSARRGCALREGHKNIVQTGADNDNISTWPPSQDRMNRGTELVVVESA